MKTTIISLIACALIQSCGSANGTLQKQSRSQAVQNKAVNGSGLDKDAAIKVARDNAAKIYGSLEGYNLVSCEQAGIWRVFLEPRNTSGSREGLEYIISKRGGTIINQREVPLAPVSAANEKSTSKSELNKEDAVAVAKKDGMEGYGSLASYDLVVCELAKVWIVVFFPKEGMDGGGPEYVVDKASGRILDKKYYQ